MSNYFFKISFYLQHDLFQNCNKKTKKKNNFAALRDVIETKYESQTTTSQNFQQRIGHGYLP